MGYTKNPFVKCAPEQEGPPSCPVVTAKLDIFLIKMNGEQSIQWQKDVCAFPPPFLLPIALLWIYR